MTRLPAMGEVAEDSRAHDGDEVLYSVTALLAVIDKPALMHWAVYETARRVVPRLHIVGARLDNEGTDSAIDYVANLRWQTDGRLTDSQLGTLAHHLFNVWALSGVRPDVHPELHPGHGKDGAVLHDDDLRDLRRMLDQFDRFLQEFAPAYEATEVVVYHPRYRYAGQADGFARIADARLIFDYKTSRKTWDRRGRERGPYAETGLQLAAYRYAQMAAVWRARRYHARSRRYYLLSADEQKVALPVPEVDGGVAIHVTPEHCKVHPMRCGPDMFEAFLHVLEVARWRINVADSVVGDPMEPPHPLPEDTSDPFVGLPT